MKNLSILLLSILAVTLLTACGSDGEPVNRQTLSATTNYRAIEGSDMVFSQSVSKVELDYTAMTIIISGEFKDANNKTRSYITPEMKMTLSSNSVYTFNNTNSVANSNIEGLKGYIDWATGMIWFTFIADGSLNVYGSTQLLYAYATTTVTDPENGKTYEHKESGYLFAFDSKCEKCTMIIYNFVNDINGSIHAYETKYEGLTVTPTITGYAITGDNLMSSFADYYTITDLTFTLDDQGHAINGSFECNGNEFEVTGPLFP